MKTTIEILLCYFVFLVLPALSTAQAIPFDSDKWTISAKGAIIDSYKGKQCLLLQNGNARLNDISFLNGLIEFDIYLSDRIAFPGVQFRIADGRNFEEVYFRPHLSNKPDAIQYTPVFKGSSSWQLYHDQGSSIPDGQNGWAVEHANGYNAVQKWHFDRWMHVKLVVAGTRADVYIDNSSEPALQVRALKRSPKAGAIGLKTAVGPVYFANFSYRLTDKPGIKPLPVQVKKKDPNLIWQWKISESFPKENLAGKGQLPDAFHKTFSWKTLDAEDSGLANIAKVTQRDRKKNAVLAKIEITTEKDQIKRLDFGYSDAVQVFCNGIAIYGGDNSYRSRDYRFLGTIGFFDSVYLPLKKGKNELVFMVTETFGGWGIQAKLENMKGVRVE